MPNEMYIIPIMEIIKDAKGYQMGVKLYPARLNALNKCTRPTK